MLLTGETAASLIFSKITFMRFHAVPFSPSKLERDGETAIGAVWEKFPALELKPQPQSQPYKDEQWSITWREDDSPSRFSLDLQKELLGAQFFVMSWDRAKEIFGLFAKEAFRALGGIQARALACQHDVMFLLPLGSDNRRLLAEKMGQILPLRVDLGPVGIGTI
jgi:hypothetical protein